MAAEASSLVLADARGLTVSEATELRSEGHKANVKFRVAKNTLVKLGLKIHRMKVLMIILMVQLCWRFLMMSLVQRQKY